jgi:chromosome segregation ATPase
MSREIQDIEYEAKEQQEQADEMSKEIEQHKDRVEKLEELIQQLKGQNIQSDELRHAEISTERARQETERRMAEIKEKKEKLLEENRELAQTVLKANEGRREAKDKVVRMQAVSPDAPGEIRATLQSIQDSLSLDQGHLAKAEGELAEARKRLEAMGV